MEERWRGVGGEKREREEGKGGNGERGREGRTRGLGEVREIWLIPKSTHLILMVNLCTPIKQELHTPIMPPT